jgi:nitrogen regulatory protein P-II 1
MKLVVFVLNREELLERVLEAYVEAGIQGATILDSEGMGHYLTYEVPLFADFKEFMKGNKPYNRTILSVIRDEAAIGRLVPLLDEVCGGLRSPGTGILFTLPVDFAVGLVGDPDTDDPPTVDGSNAPQTGPQRPKGDPNG